MAEKESLESKRVRFGNLLGDGEKLNKTGLPDLDVALAALVKEKGKAYTTLVLLVFKSKQDILKQARAGASKEETDQSAMMQSIMLQQLANMLEYDMDDVMNDVEALQELGVKVIKAEKEAGDPNGVLESLRASAAQD